MRTLPVAAVTALLTAAAATPAHAACVTSTPASVQHADSPVDGGGLAPDIATVTASVDGVCGYRVDPALTESLVDGDGAFIYLDVDGNPATGDPIFTGADVTVGTVGVQGPEGPPRLARWNGSGYDFAGGADLTAPTGGGFAAAVDQLGIPSGVTTRFAVATIYQGYYDDYFDRAPDAPGTVISLPVSYATTAPPPPPAPAPAPAPAAPSAPAADTGAASEDASCRVPRVKGLRLTRAEDKLLDAGCDLADAITRRYSTRVKRGRAIGTSPAAGRRTSRPVKIIVSRGRRKAKARSAGADRLATLQLRARLGAGVGAPAR